MKIMKLIYIIYKVERDRERQKERDSERKRKKQGQGGSAEKDSVKEKGREGNMRKGMRKIKTKIRIY